MVECRKDFKNKLALYLIGYQMNNKRKRNPLVDVVISIFVLAILVAVLTLLPRALLTKLSITWVSQITSLLLASIVVVGVVFLVKSKRFMIIVYFFLWLALVMILGSYYVNAEDLNYDVTLLSAGVTIGALAFTLLAIFSKLHTEKVTNKSTIISQSHHGLPQNEIKRFVWGLIGIIFLSAIIRNLRDKREKK